MVQRFEKTPIRRRAVPAVTVSQRERRVETLPLFGDVGQLAEAIGEFDAAAECLEASRNRRSLGGSRRLLASTWPWSYAEVFSPAAGRDYLALEAATFACEALAALRLVPPAPLAEAVAGARSPTLSTHACSA